MRSIFVLATLLSVAFAGCLNNDSMPPPAWEDAADWRDVLHDVSQPLYDVADAAVEHHSIPLRDGVELDSFVVIPRIDGPVPTIVHLTPYWGGGDLSTCVTIPGVTDDRGCGVQYLPFVERGYAYALVSVRGTGNSGGCYTLAGPDEAQDSAEAIEYYARQSFSNGRIGAMGLSYDGTTVNDVWSYGPPSLKAVMPVSGISQMYEYSYENGIHRNIQGIASFNTYYWATVGLAPVGIEGGAQIVDPAGMPGAFIGELCEDQGEVQLAGQSAVYEPEMTPFWEARDFAREYDLDPERERAAVLYVQGLQDWNVAVNHMDPFIAKVKDSGVPLYFMLGQWGHEWPWGADWRPYVTAFFDQYVKGVDTGIEDAPGAFIQNTDGDWRAEDTWPSSEGFLTFYPDGQQGLAAGPSEGSVSWMDNGGAGAQVGQDSFVAWQSEPFDQETQISGIPSIQSVVTGGAPRANIIFALGTTGGPRDEIWSWAPQSLNLAEDPSSFDPDVTGQAIPVDINFHGTEFVIHPGERLALYASGVVLPGRFAPSLESLTPPQTLQVSLADTVLRVPVDGSVEALEADFCSDLCGFAMDFS